MNRKFLLIAISGMPALLGIYQVLYATPSRFRGRRSRFYNYVTPSGF
jgi:hypothetical protein